MRPLLVEVGLLVGCRFEDSDWIAVDHGLAVTNSEIGCCAFTRSTIRSTSTVLVCSDARPSARSMTSPCPVDGPDWGEVVNAGAQSFGYELASQL